MGYSSIIQKKAADRLAQRRLEARRNADFRREEIFAKLPRAAELEKGIGNSGIRAARAVVAGGNVAEELERLKNAGSPSKKQLDYCNTWVSEWKFSPDMLREAYADSLDLRQLPH